MFLVHLRVTSHLGHLLCVPSAGIQKSQLMLRAHSQPLRITSQWLKFHGTTKATPQGSGSFLIIVFVLNSLYTNSASTSFLPLLSPSQIHDHHFKKVLLLYVIHICIHACTHRDIYMHTMSPFSFARMCLYSGLTSWVRLDNLCGSSSPKATSSPVSAAVALLQLV